MIKLIATDLDGTLLDSKSSLNSEIYDIIKELRKMGIVFVAASGRQRMSIEKVFKPVKDDIVYIAENGGYVTYKDEELYINPMKKDIINEILDSAKEVKDAPVFICGKKYSYTDKKSLADFMSKPNFGYEIKLVDNLKNVDDDIFKVGLFDTKDPRESSLKIMKPRFGDRVHLTLSGYNSLDFLNPEVNKGVALNCLKDRFNVKKEEMIAFGDNFNDIEMFDEVGTSYAMLNADEYVRKRASRVIGSNDEDAVINTIKSIIKEIN